LVSPWLFLPVCLVGHKSKEKKIRATMQYEIEFGERMNAEQILEKILESFKIEYWQIENVEIKKGKFKVTFMRDYPLLKKEQAFHFDKKDQLDVESIFMKMLPNKTTIK
jgi:coenzyme F420-reducing hydrogenase beta subunit